MNMCLCGVNVCVCCSPSVEDPRRSVGHYWSLVSISLSVGSNMLFKELSSLLTNPYWDLGDYSTGKCLLSYSAIDYM